MQKHRDVKCMVFSGTRSNLVLLQHWFKVNFCGSLDSGLEQANIKRSIAIWGL